MIETDRVFQLLPRLIDSIARREPVLIEGLDDSEIIALLPILTRHKLESIALLSMEETSAMATFYNDTYEAQFSAVRDRLAKPLKASAGVFLRGFPRCLDYSDFYTPGMRSDIDLYVPVSTCRAFREAAMQAGFDYYGFDQQRVFVLNERQSDALTARQWASKDLPLTLPVEVALPDLPVELSDCYLPYVLREGKVYLFISIEIHHLYTHLSDIDVLEANREYWPQMGVDRCNPEATLFFNLIRLYRGVLADEARMRLVLDSACLFTSKHHRFDLGLLQQLIVGAPDTDRVMAVCLALANLHPLFEPLVCFPCTHIHAHLAGEWLSRFQQSLRAGAQ